MDIVTPNSVPVSERWKSQYYMYNDGWGSVFLTCKLTSEEVYKQLLLIEKLNAPNMVEQINNLLGGDSWTVLWCSSCKTKTKEPVISFDVNYGEYGYCICKPCLTKALRKLKELK